MQIRSAAEADWPQIVALLHASGLPVAGLYDHLPTTLVATAGADLLGCAALELYDQAALLRSVAVTATQRGYGVGQALTAAALGLARQHGIQQVYLLTETAPDFFVRFGFQAGNRTTVPPSVRTSVEWTEACPASALVMVADIAPIPA